MGSFPIVYHVVHLTFTAYGFGLVLTFWSGYQYLGRRLARRHMPHAWLGPSAAWSGPCGGVRTAC